MELKDIKPISKNPYEKYGSPKIGHNNNNYEITRPFGTNISNGGIKEREITPYYGTQSNGLASHLDKFDRTPVDTTPKLADQYNSTNISIDDLEQLSKSTTQEAMVTTQAFNDGHTFDSNNLKDDMSWLYKD